jgi:hypothetical protein
VGGANNNDDHSGDSGSFDNKMSKAPFSQTPYSTQVKSKTTKQPGRPSSSPGEHHNSLRVATASPVNLEAAEFAAHAALSPRIKTSMSPPSHPPPGKSSTSPVKRPVTSPVSFLSDIDSMERSLYGSPGSESASSGSRSSSVLGSRVKKPSSIRSASSGVSSSDSDSDSYDTSGDSGEGFTFNLANLEKLTISMSNLDKLIEKTPRGGDQAQADEEDMDEHDFVQEEDGGFVGNPHLMLQQWMMFPVRGGEEERDMPAKEKDQKTAKEVAKGVDELEEEIIVEEARVRSSSRGSGSSRESKGGESTFTRSFSGSSRSSAGSYHSSTDSSEFETDSDYVSSEEEVEEEEKVKEEVKQRRIPPAKSPTKFAPPHGPPPKKKGIGSTFARGSIPPPSTPSPKKLKKQQLQMQQQYGEQQHKDEKPPPRSLLQAARSRIANPMTVHGGGVQKYI